MRHGCELQHDLRLDARLDEMADRAGCGALPRIRRRHGGIVHGPPDRGVHAIFVPDRRIREAHFPADRSFAARYSPRRHQGGDGIGVVEIEIRPIVGDRRDGRCAVERRQDSPGDDFGLLAGDGHWRRLIRTAGLPYLNQGAETKKAPPGALLFVAIDPLAALVALLRLDRQRGDWPGIQALQVDRLARLLAIAIGAVVDSLQRRVDLADQLALAVTGTELDGAVRL